MVLLDGKFVDPEVIDPEKHKFIGMFRPATNPFHNFGCFVVCNCGLTLQTPGEPHQHWQKGCYDKPQYVTIKEDD